MTEIIENIQTLVKELKVTNLCRVKYLNEKPIWCAFETWDYTDQEIIEDLYFNNKSGKDIVYSVNKIAWIETYNWDIEFSIYGVDEDGEDTKCEVCYAKEFGLLVYDGDQLHVLSKCKFKSLMKSIEKLIKIKYKSFNLYIMEPLLKIGCQAFTKHQCEIFYKNLKKYL